VRSGLDVPTFATREQAAAEGGTVWARNVREFCLNSEFNLTFRDLLIFNFKHAFSMSKT
jgi:hypothetical protein